MHEIAMRLSAAWCALRGDVRQALPYCQQIRSVIAPRGSVVVLNCPPGIPRAEVMRIVGLCGEVFADTGVRFVVLAGEFDAAVAGPSAAGGATPPEGDAHG